MSPSSCFAFSRCSARASAWTVCDGRSSVLVEVGDDHLPAFGCDRAAGGCTDPAGSTGDDDDAVLNPSHVRWLPRRENMIAWYKAARSGARAATSGAAFKRCVKA